MTGWEGEGKRRRGRSDGLRGYTPAAGAAGFSATENPRPALCWICASKDHAMLQCPLRATRHTALKCDACKKMGHVPQVCWTTYPDLRPSQASFARASGTQPRGVRPGGRYTAGRRGEVAEEDEDAQAAWVGGEGEFDWSMGHAHGESGAGRAVGMHAHAGMADEANADQEEAPQPRLATPIRQQRQLPARSPSRGGRRFPASYDVADREEEAELRRLQQRTEYWMARI